MIKQLQSDIAVLKREVAKLKNMRIAGRSRLETKSGLSFGSELPGPEAIHIQPKTVVIVAQPQEADEVLSVREVAHRTNLPKPCVTGGEPATTECYYVWHGESFTAYPAFGMKPVDYLGQELKNAAGASVPGNDFNLPRYESVYQTCSYKNGYWSLEDKALPSAEVVFVKIVNFIGPSADTAEWLTVQRMKRVKVSIEGATPVLYDWQPDGATEPAECWPNFVAAHYLPMRNQTPEVIVPMSEVDGSLYVWQKNRFFLGQPTTGFPQSDCQVAI